MRAVFELIARYGYRGYPTPGQELGLSHSGGIPSVHGGRKSICDDLISGDH
jgi:hypothetical protein